MDDSESETMSNVLEEITTEKSICRLCLDDCKSAIDIFETSQLDEFKDIGDNVNAPIVDLLYKLFFIKYKKSILLPDCICVRCLGMVEAFDDFRNCIMESEQYLQNNLKEMEMSADEERPGLNGNPGIFEPDEDCEIEEINPEQEFESSEDDFSLESESEEEQVQEDDNQSMLINDIDVIAVEPNSETPETLTYEPVLVESFISGEVHVKNTFLCQFCDLAFTTQTDCVDHETRTHDSTLPYSCSFCPMQTTTRQILIIHIKELHDAERPYICAHCNKGFCRRSDLKKHTIVHTGVRPYTCSVCSKSFSRNTNLTKHMRIHSSEKPHVCQQCPRSFPTALELIRHTRTHNEIKPFQCSLCPASFTRRDKLQLHEQVHRRDSGLLQQQVRQINPNMGATPIQDKIMLPLNLFPEQHEELQNFGTSFLNNRLNPQLQQRPYKQPRSFVCSVCDKTFARERDLQRHQALHLDTLFTCKVCGISFNRQEKLLRHEQEHHTPHYPCDICRITFSQHEELELHMKIHELQQNVAMNTKAALTSVTPPAPSPLQIFPNSFPQLTSKQRPTALPTADISFYSNMVPTMNLGFYSETNPEDRNGQS